MATPKIIPYTVKLRSVVPEKTFSKPPVVYTNDLRSAEFQFKITDMDASELLTATAKTMLYMRDGSFFQNPSTDVSRVGNVFSYLLKENEGNHAGIAKIQLVVYFNEGLTNEQNFPTQLYEFEIINGLETKVAQEVMIYDWTTLTRDAQDYLDQFVANEATRQQQFADAQAQRTTDFGAAQTQRTTDFNTAEQSRTTAFNAAESARAEGYTADHGRAETDHTTAAADHTTAVTDHTTAAADHTLAASDHTTAAADHTIVKGYNTRLQAEETATANNKVSAVKGKTFADVDARFEDVETDTTMMGTNLVTNGDFSNGTTGWTSNNTTLAVSVAEMSVTGSGTSSNVTLMSSGNLLKKTLGNKVYYRFEYTVISSLATVFQAYLTPYDLLWVQVNPVVNNKYVISTIKTALTSSPSSIVFETVYPDAATANTKITKVKYAFALDLTATFGAGNEPTVEQMDAIMAKFENSWFDGAKNLFRANTTLNKLMELDARTEFEAKNLVANGDFSNGTTSWTGTKLTVTNGVASFYSDNTGATGTDYPNFAQFAKFKASDKYYISYQVVSYANVSAQSFFQLGGAAVHHFSTTGFKSTTYTPPVDLNAFYFNNVVNAGGIVDFKIDNVSIINLTATFGAGKEPTLAEMDRLMARFPNSWFDGVKPIQTIEQLYQEKANKVQEAWITPTLLNGWVAFNAGAAPAYFKDEFGSIVIKGIVKSGTIGSPIFTLPAGYRPITSSVYFPITSNNLFGQVFVDTAGAVNCNVGNNVMVSLNIRLKADQ